MRGESLSPTWINEFKLKKGRPLRVLHVGNIANNAYNNAKVQRQRGIDADVICHDYYHIMGCPEWEDADFSGEFGDPFRPQWYQCDLNRFERPDWFAQGAFVNCANYLLSKGDGDTVQAARLWRVLSVENGLIDPSAGAVGHMGGAELNRALAVRGMMALARKILPRPVKRILHQLLIRVTLRAAPSLDRAYDLVLRFRAEFPARLAEKGAGLSIADIAPWMGNIREWQKLFSQYDVIQAYATYPILPILAGYKNFAAYEHGTIREIPFENNAQGRLCAISYKLSPVVFITNSDNLIAAGRLGLQQDQVICLPHAFDNEKLFRFARENAGSFVPPVDHVVFFSPSRQHWKDRDPSMAKGNDAIFYAAKELLAEGYNFRLELVEWGRDVECSKELIRQLGIDKAVVWVKPMKKRQLWAKYLSVHAVIDQFLLPALGGVGFETMALGRRLLTAMDMELAVRFFGASPPLFDVRDVASTIVAMRRVLEDPQDQQRIGDDAREWINSYHSADRVCRIQVDAYRRILETVEVASA
ncbi:glycosyltransferase [Mariprofundus erugo]|uniref:Glycosyltransferase n=1 Tax=Mariprofundus erugo TaxID=2528639 RepID=A0A5R9GTZ6_9PROT|nr:glycosyltransferase [Mariprofundus erugo]TLS69038.1 glycosyltransferase [Mariprofundus erugo]